MDVALDTITGYLDLKDLRQVRYLNTAWNEAAKRHLRNHYFNLSSKKENVLKLSDLVRKANRNSFSIPFQKLNIHFLKDSNFYHFNRFIKHYGNLFVAYRIKFHHPILPRATKSMIHILSYSTNLKMLEFGDISKQEFKTHYPKLHLPKLTSLILQSCPRTTSGLNFLKAILEASPSLKFLKICEIYVEMTSLISVLANRDLKVVMKNIYSSSLPEDSSLNGIFPIYLTSVSFDSSGFDNFIISKKISEFIQQYTQTIKHLKIRSINTKENIQFPTMSVLETLYLNYHLYYESPQRLAEFSRGQFPALKNLRLELSEPLAEQRRISVQNPNPFNSAETQYTAPFYHS